MRPARTLLSISIALVFGGPQYTKRAHITSIDTAVNSDRLL